AETGAGGSGRVTSSQPPATSRSDFPSARPSRRTPPDSAISAARVRDRPRSRASAASTRSPASPSGTGSDRVSGIVVRRESGLAPAARGPAGGREGRGRPRLGAAGGDGLVGRTGGRGGRALGGVGLALGGVGRPLGSGRHRRGVAGGEPLPRPARRGVVGRTGVVVEEGGGRRAGCRGLRDPGGDVHVLP